MHWLKGLSTEWKTRFAEDSTRVGNSLVFKVSKEQKEFMENRVSDLEYELNYPKSWEFTPTEDGCYICTVQYESLDLDEESELREYLKELR